MLACFGYWESGEREKARNKRTGQGDFLSFPLFCPSYIKITRYLIGKVLNSHTIDHHQQLQLLEQ